MDAKLYPFRNSTPGSPCINGGTLNGCGWCFPKPPPPTPPAPPLPSPPSETDWFFEAKRGVFTHYLHALQSSNGTNAQGNASTSWTDTVDAFDADAYANSAAATGARYATITLMQGDKFLLGPNSVYNKLTGYKPGEACSKRDLVLDIHAALAKRGLKLLLYWTCDGPTNDHQASAGMGLPGSPGAGYKPCRIHPGSWPCRHDTNLTKPVPMGFVQRWAQVLEEYTVRYGDKVSGWWVDGCYQPYYGSGDASDNKLHPYYLAVKKGNPQAMVSFNRGVRHPISRARTDYSKWNDFTNGETDDFSDVPNSRSVETDDGGIAQWHSLGFIGSFWASPGTTRYNASALRSYSKAVAAGGGVLTVDLQLLRNGSMNAAQVELIREAWRDIETDG